MTMQWFITSLLFAPPISLADDLGRRCNFLLKAEKPIDALAKARFIGNNRGINNYLFAGVEELLAIDGEIKDGVEAIWCEETLAKASAGNLFKAARQQIDQHLGATQSPSGWYAGELVLAETFDRAIPDEDILIWRNTYLITASTALDAQRKLQDIGKQEEGVGRHQSDDRDANWRFEGILKLVSLEEIPGDGSVLWCETLNGSASEIAARIPAEDDLGLFKWLRERKKSSPWTD